MRNKKKIILYCAGSFAINVLKNLQKTYEIVNWVDKNYELIGKIEGYVIKNPDILYDLESTEYDMVYICTGIETFETEIREQLMSKYQIDSNKIISAREATISNNKAIYRDILDTVLKNKAPLCGQKKYKVRFFVSTREYLWTTLYSLISAFKTDKEADILIVPNDLKNQKLIQTIESNGLKYVDEENYNFSEDKPDISVIFDYFHGKEKIKKITANSKYSCWLSYNLQNPSQDFAAFANIISEKMNLGVDKCILDKSVYEKVLKEIPDKEEYLACLGSPKFDKIFDAINGELAIPGKWEKIKDKRKVLWATEHGTIVYANLSFKIYFKDIYSYFQKNKDVALIFRPHPGLCTELTKETGFWSMEEWNSFVETINETENMVFDDFSDYSYAYRFCDGVLTSINTGIYMSALPLRKPIGLIYYPQDERILDFQDVAEKLFSIQCKDELYHFLDEMKNGIDSTECSRKELFEKYIVNFDGKNGERMKDYLLSDFKKKRLRIDDGEHDYENGN